MNVAQIRNRRRNGFQPFALVTTDGRRFEVARPEFIAVGKSVVGVFGSDDLSTKIDALHIVSLEDLPTRKKR